MAQVESSGKPEAIREKIVQGMLSKYFGEICVLGQPFFKDPDKTVGVLLKDSSAEIKRYTRFEVGEGIEVKKVEIGVRYNFGLLKVGKDKTYAGGNYIFPDGKISRPHLTVLALPTSCGQTRTAFRLSIPYVRQAVGVLRDANFLRQFVRSEGIEPPTLWFEARYSIH